jgi:hypothetical protein
MFVSTEIVNCLKTLIGWKNHYDTGEIPALAPALNTSDSGEYYQSFHPALRLDVIKATIPINRTLDSYLTEKVEDGITQVLNDIITSRKYGQYAKQILGNDAVLDGYGWSQDTIINEGRFVGFALKTNLAIGLQIVLKSIGLQFTQPQTDLKIYVFHSSKINPIYTITISTTSGIEWHWNEQTDKKLSAENSTLVGGTWVIGYYQDDIAGNAINYTNFDWRVGPCGSCDGTTGLKRQDNWRNLHRYIDLQPIYVPAASIGVVGKMFDLNSMINDFSSSWGMNFKFNAECDLTYFFCSNKMLFKNTLGLKVAHMILQDMKFSQQINYIEENLKHMIIRDLEGDKDTNAVNLVEKLEESIKAINFDHSKLSSHCLSCNSNKGVNYGVV